MKKSLEGWGGAKETGPTRQALLAWGIEVSAHNHGQSKRDPRGSGWKTDAEKMKLNVDVFKSTTQPSNKNIYRFLASTWRRKFSMSSEIPLHSRLSLLSSVPLSSLLALTATPH